MDELKAVGNPSSVMTAAEEHKICHSMVSRWASEKSRKQLSTTLKSSKQDGNIYNTSATAKKTTFHPGRKFTYADQEHAVYALFLSERAKGKKVSGLCILVADNNAEDCTRTAWR